MDDDRSQQLAEFVKYAQTLDGDEKGEAQVFIDRLFRAFSRSGYKEAGAKLEMRVKNDTGGTSFADLVWKPVVLIEMKKRGEDLSRHLLQAFNYWVQLVPGRPRYVVLCNFDEFRIYDFDKDINQPQDTVTLDELPRRWGPLNFLWPTNEPPRFKVDREKATREAADLLAKVYRTLRERKAATPETCQRFALQCLVCLFSEDIGLLPKHFFTQLLDECVDPPKAFDLLDGLFRAMNARDGAKGGRYKPVPFFNGGIFAQSAAIELDPRNELVFLKKAATYNWADVSPDIFGTIFQHSMEAKERHAMGAHYTSQADIMRIVGPTIVQPFTTAIQRAGTLKELTALRDRLTTLRVLDPACGSGNFLYIAYREMRRLEAAIILRQSELSKREVTGQAAFAAVSPRQFYGMDILPFAVELAKVTLSLAPKLASDELHTGEKTLPLDNLDRNVVAKDALIDEKGAQAHWPPADVVIGNPPFLDARKMTKELGRDCVGRLAKQYSAVPRRADHCVYWFRRAHDHLPACAVEDPFAGRAGLVGTQAIRNNYSRIGGLDHIIKSATIVEAVENQPWSGEANVHVSIASWVKTSPSRGSDSGTTPLPRRADVSESALLIPSPRRLWSKVDPKLAPLDQGNPTLSPKVVTAGKRGRIRKDKSYELAVRECGHINASLSDSADVASAKILEVCRQPKRCFEGVQPGSNGFRLTTVEADKLRRSESVAEIMFPYLNGDELLGGEWESAPRYLIDFGDRDLLTASKWARTLAIVQAKVLPGWQRGAFEEQSKTGVTSGEHQDRLQTWWLLKRRRSRLLTSISALDRFVVCSRVTKRPVFAFISTAVRPDSSLTCFTFNDDYSFAVLQSDSHWQWFIAKCSKLKSDFRYTPDSVFDTFPWPQSPTKKQIRQVAAAGRAVRVIRSNTLPTIKGGLRALYRTLELPGKNPLKDAHAKLDAAVLDAYGFSPKKDLLKQLLDLNLAVAARIESGDKVTAPGVPPSFGDTSSLISTDCIRPTRAAPRGRIPATRRKRT